MPVKKMLKIQTQVVDRYKWTIYMDETGKWRWHFQLAKGTGIILGESHRGFANKYTCIGNAHHSGFIELNEWEDGGDWIKGKGYVK